MDSSLLFKLKTYICIQVKQKWFVRWQTRMLTRKWNRFVPCEQICPAHDWSEGTAEAVTDLFTRAPKFDDTKTATQFIADIPFASSFHLQLWCNEFRWLLFVRLPETLYIFPFLRQIQFVIDQTFTESSIQLCLFGWSKFGGNKKQAKKR